MCGIHGELRFDGKLPSSENHERALRRLAPRGPDARGIWDNFKDRPISNSPKVLFGHQRLSIIDLSDHSSQPFVDHELGLAIVFNGEIYNYKQIKEELCQLGYKFRSSGDTEIILKAYHHWKEKALNRFNGMFAFSIWDFKNNELFAARDRLGIKPYYYVSDAKRFLFSSSLVALTYHDDVKVSLNREALHYYMTFHSVVPAPATILSPIQKLNPGCFLKIDSQGKLTKSTYWSFQNSRRAEDAHLQQSDWLHLVYEKLSKSVERRLVADVPVGIFLSGGLDSSLITALVREQSPGELHTFSIGFSGAENEKGNEFEYSDLVARKFETIHHKINVATSELLPELDSCIAAMEEPMVSHDNVGFYLLSQFAKQRVKVVQSGQGADEVFAGYKWYPPMLKTSDALAEYKKHFFDRSHEELSNTLSKAFVDKDFSTKFVEQFFSKYQSEGPLDRVLHLDTSVMLVDDPVKRVDNMTMAFGLEARVPFLDHEVIELAARMPPEMKIQKHGKHILRELGYRMLPHEVIDRPKGYFPVPELKYVQGPFLKYAQRTFSNQDNKLVGRYSSNIFRQEFIKNLMDSPKSNITPLGGSMLWQITVLEKWLQIHQIEVC
ncbi:MAG: N-acetylglutaminylglutamine amidotransferase [Bdellovibrionales bacterium CG10_big_fil_rev_8_21_14_0_10_45_34]|nr:MAG: N-acetylglutaminylglutamine amidotransferase [Bdellovibrionales bacterium CG10_big_fil_rev_8_21_14_0_10_45_34]